MEILRNMWRRKFRTFLTISGIAIGIFAFTVMGSMALKFNKMISGGKKYITDKDGNIVEYDNDAVEALIASEAYKEIRAKEYPDFKDYLDGIVKNDQAQIQVYIDACLAVKEKYPKG